MPSDYEEFRLQVTPDIAAPGQVVLQILDCPVPGMAGPQGPATAPFSPADLNLLRDPSHWGGGNAADLRRIGASAFASVTNGFVAAAIQAGMQAARERGNKMRLVFSLVPAEREQPSPVRVSELPVEVIYTPGASFYAPQIDTPISRALQAKPDRPTVELTPPLRILVVAASPNGLPSANIAGERTVISGALADLVATGSVVLDFCDPPTREQLVRSLRNAYHVVHFVGHGSISRIGGDPTPKAFICLQDAGGNLDPLDGDTLDLLLRNCPTANVVVITGCSTARLPPAVNGNPFAATAFDGIAQRLLGAGNASRVSAVVAMQFDLESAAAVAFSGEFYTQLLKPDVTLDAAVTHARNAVVGALTLGSPAWANPVLYWRCENGRAFDVQPFVAQPISAAVAAKITALDIQIDTMRKFVEDIAAQPEAVRNAAAALRDNWSRQIEALYAQKGALLGNAIRLKGGSGVAGQTMTFRLALRLRSAAVLSQITVRLEFEADAFEFVSASAGANAANPPLTASDATSVTLSVNQVSAGAIVNEGEYEVATVDLRVKSAAPSTRSVRIAQPQVTTVPQTDFRALDALAFLSGE
jgi:hypothetical protein